MIANLFSGKMSFTRIGKQAAFKPLTYFLFLLKDIGFISDNFSKEDIFEKISGRKKITDFHGYECANFIYNYRQCKLAKPKKAAPGKPWVLRARIWAIAPQTDLALLAKGYHIAYCDVNELYGNKESNEIWTKFYNYMQKLGLSRKVAIESLSRGSFYAYNWALENGEKISCIYADNPPLDIKSWPGGLGKGVKSKNDWKLFQRMHRLRSDKDAIDYKLNPLDRAAEIARLNFPILHVCGSEDEFSPVDENTLPFQKKILENGGRMEVIIKQGVGHQPHSLEDPAPIVKFILNASK
jgi:hypothetical protein